MELSLFSRNTLLEILGWCFFYLYLVIGYYLSIFLMDTMNHSYETAVLWKKISIETIQHWVCDCY